MLIDENITFSDESTSFDTDFGEVVTIGDSGLTPEQESEINANTEARHTHENKDVLDKFTGNNDSISYLGKAIRFEQDGNVITNVVYTDNEIIISVDGVFYPTDPIVIPLGGTGGSGHTHYNKDALDAVYIDEYGNILLGGDVALTTVNAYSREELDEHLNVNYYFKSEIDEKINLIRGGIDEIEALIDESGVLE